ncbi:MAG TPA: glycosyltransferase family 4 protein [Anaerolineae bacterium]|jgi:glycosyltransferase involved in cell wall biosynthesis
MNILFLSRWFPYPPDNGSRIRIFNLIKHLSLHNEIDLVSFAGQSVADEQLAAMQDYCRCVEIVRYQPFQSTRLNAILGFFSRRPRSVIDTYSLEMERLVQRTARNHSIDLVIASQIDMAPYALTLPDTPKIFEEVELTTLYEQFVLQTHPLKKFRKGLMWWKLSHYAADILQAFDGCTIVAGQERERVLQVAPGYQPIWNVPNGVDTGYYAAGFGKPQADTLVYAGALTYQANFDAVDYFLREIFPRIQAVRPQVKLFVTGKLEGVPVEQLPQNEGVVYTGYLDDIRPRVAQSWCSIAPLRIGGGTRLKILESLASGTPVVATSKGAEGLDLVPDKDLLIADDPAEFAAAVLRLLQDETLRQKLSRNGRQTVEATYDWQSIGFQFNNFIKTVVSRNGRHREDCDDTG